MIYELGYIYPIYHMCYMYYITQGLIQITVYDNFQYRV